MASSKTALSLCIEMILLENVCVLQYAYVCLRVPTHPFQPQIKPLSESEPAASTPTF